MLTNTIHRQQKSVVLLYILIISSISIIMVFGAAPTDNSKLYINGDVTTSYVNDAMNNTMLFRAADGSNVSLANAKITVRVEGLDTYFYSGANKLPASSDQIFYTNNTGYLEIKWETPTISADTSVTIKYSITDQDNSGTYTAPDKIVTITHKVLYLDQFELNINKTEVYPDGAVSVGIYLFSIDGYDVSGINIALSSTGNIGSFSQTNLITNLLGQANTTWIAPSSISSNVTFSILAQATLVNNFMLSKSVDLTLVPYDFHDSFITYDTPVISDTTVSLKITTAGRFGIVPNVQVDILIDSVNADHGTLSSTSGTSNSDGELSVNWQVPVVPETMDFIFILQLSKSGASDEVNQTITVQPISYNVDINVNASSLDVNQTLAININVSYNDLTSDNVNLDISTPLGYFTLSNDKTASVSIGMPGNYTFYWIADLIPIDIIGSDVVISLTVYDNQSSAVNKDINVHVNPLPPVKYAVSVDHPTFFYNQNVTFTVLVLYNNGTGFSDAIVSMSGIVGEFDGSSDGLTVQGVTDINGMVQFIWSPKGISNPDSNVTLSFDLKINIASLDIVFENTIDIELIPLSSVTANNTIEDTTTSNTNDNFNLFGNTGLIAALLAILAILGIGSFVILKKR